MTISFSALRRVKPMEAALYKASRVFNNCPAIATKLRAINYNTEEQVQAQKNQASYLMHLAARTTPKGLHCLSMRLTSEYFSLDPERRQMPNQQNYNDPNLNHYVVFSDNVLASSVVVNSTISSSKVKFSHLFCFILTISCISSSKFIVGCHNYISCLKHHKMYRFIYFSHILIWLLIAVGRNLKR